MNLECKLKTTLVTECRKLGAYARRHEDRWAIGLLDLSIKFPGHPHLLAEAKIVDWQKFEPTPRQYVEGQRYEAAGGLCLSDRLLQNSTNACSSIRGRNSP